MRSCWYVELYEQNARSKKWCLNVPDWAMVRALITRSRKAARGDILRILAPSEVCENELAELRAMGQPLFP
jgi:hypothetical protein